MGPALTRHEEKWTHSGTLTPPGLLPPDDHSFPGLPPRDLSLPVMANTSFEMDRDDDRDTVDCESRPQVCTGFHSSQKAVFLSWRRCLSVPRCFVHLPWSPVVAMSPQSHPVGAWSIPTGDGRLRLLPPVLSIAHTVRSSCPSAHASLGRLVTVACSVGQGSSDYSCLWSLEPEARRAVHLRADWQGAQGSGASDS